MDNNRAGLVRIWANMINRCYSEDNPQRANYGGRGIDVCERWHKFENFYQDMHPRPDGLSLDRIDNSLGYSPENCRWADSKTQNNNRRSNVKIKCRGEEKNLGQWAEESGISPESIVSRIKRGWDAEKAIFTTQYAQRKNHIIIEHDGRSGTLKQWEEWTGIPGSVIRTRIYEHAWPAARALTEPVGEYFGGNHGAPRRDNVLLEIDGETKSAAEWSRVSGVAYSTIRNRYKRGVIHRECVFGKSS